MDKLDEQIKEALSASDQKALAEITAETGVFEMIGMAFRGKQAWLMYYLWVGGLVAFVSGLYFLQQFLGTPDLKTALGWMMAMQLCLSVFIIIKIIGWQHMHRQELLREFKRLELKLMLMSKESPD